MTDENKKKKTASRSTTDEPGASRPEAEGQTIDETTAPGPTPADSTPPGSLDSTPHPFEALLDEYPVRDPSEDPVWSVRIVKGWMFFLAFNFAWMFLFFILGLFYE